jgi:RNA polymerase sigma factor (sigma-70 family)
VFALASEDAAERARAFETLVACYWKPLYKYARVAWRKSREDAEDLTQSFFLRALEKESLAEYKPAKASFRTFLRLLFDRHLSNERKAGRRLKRGGGQVQLDFEAAETEIGKESGALSPEEYFQREWVRSVFAIALDRLRQRCVRDEKEMQFAIFEMYDVDESNELSYRELGELFGINDTAVTNHLYVMRRWFREMVLATLREATASDAEFQTEARALLGGVR